MERRSYLHLEELEARCVPTTWGNPWPVPEQLTLSFVPDGTQVAAMHSELFGVLNQQYGNDTAAWQREILRAFQTWAVHAPINIGLVSDSGEALGAPSRLSQHSSRFGDIRLAGFPMSAALAALALPYDPTAGTWAGDVMLNTSQSFGSAGQGDFDLYTIALHEAAHVLGIPHSHEALSAVYGQYHGSVDGLTASDIESVQALYGPRSPDRFERLTGNDSLATATRIRTLAGRGQVEGDLTTLDDVDVYQFTSSLRTSRMTVSLKVSGLSLLVPRLTVYDASGRMLDTTVAVDPLDNDLFLDVNLAPRSRFYVKVEGAVDNVFGIGQYHLSVAPFSEESSRQRHRAPTFGSARAGDTHHDWHRFRFYDNVASILSRYFAARPGNTADTALGLSPAAHNRSTEIRFEVDETSTEAVTTVEVAEPQIFRLRLESSGAGLTGTSVRFTITREDGTTWLERTLRAGEPFSTTQPMEAGLYTFRVTAAGADGAPPPALQLTLTATALSDAVGPYLESNLAAMVAAAPHRHGHLQEMAPDGRPPANTLAPDQTSAVLKAAPLERSAPNRAVALYEPVSSPYWVGPWAASPRAPEPDAVSTLGGTPGGFAHERPTALPVQASYCGEDANGAAENTVRRSVLPSIAAFPAAIDSVLHSAPARAFGESADPVVDLSTLEPEVLLAALAPWTPTPVDSAPPPRQGPAATRLLLPTVLELACLGGVLVSSLAWVWSGHWTTAPATGKRA